MCGRFNVIQNSGVRWLLEYLGIDVFPEPKLNVAPLSKIDFIHQTQQTMRLTEGVWSILIEENPNTGHYRAIKNRDNKPLSTFNAASRNLLTSQLWHPLYLSRRAIIPASGFHEWGMYEGKKTCFNIEAADGRALALGAIYDIRNSNECPVARVANITLPPHSKFSHFHKKSIPLIIPESDFAAWLDPDFSQVEAFRALLEPVIYFDWKVTPVNSPAKLNPIGDGLIISADKIDSFKKRQRK